MRKKNKKTIAIKGITYILLILLTLFIIIPLVWMMISGFKSNGDLFTNSFGLPKEWLFSNYILAWKVGIGRYLLNSVFVTFVSVALTVIISALAAFALTNNRLYFKGRNAVFIFILAGLMLAPQVSVVPLYKMLNQNAFIQYLLGNDSSVYSIQNSFYCYVDESVFSGSSSIIRRGCIYRWMYLIWSIQQNYYAFM